MFDTFIVNDLGRLIHSTATRLNDLSHTYLDYDLKSEDLLLLLT